MNQFNQKINILMQQFLVLNPDNVFILTLAETLGITWWGPNSAEIISDDGKRNLFNDPVIRSDPRKKIMIKEIPIHDPCPEVLDLTWCDFVIFTTMEMVQETPMPMTEYLAKFYPCNKYILFGGGHCGFPDTPDERFYVKFKETFARVVCGNTPYVPSYNKTKLFDVLLGTPKAHRRFIFENLQQHNLLDQCLVSMHPHSPEFQLGFQGPFDGLLRGDVTDYESPELSVLENQAVAELKTPTEFGSAFCSARYSSIFCMSARELTDYYHIPTHDFKGYLPFTALPFYHVWCSQLVPVQIYDHTWYSIISETHITGDLLSEKTAKGLIARRPFIMFGSQHTLCRLHDLGFKTFSDVIDESYDNIADPVERYTAAMNSVVALSRLDPQEVYAQLSTVLDHNYQTIIDLPSQLNALAEFISKNLLE